MANPLEKACSTTPRNAGLSPPRLERIEAVLRREVEEGRIPGAVALIYRRGSIAYLKAVGMRDQAAGLRMTEDSIFRIYSMTKPLTSVAVMLLYEEGRFNLLEPVSVYLPEFREMRVGVSTTDHASGQTIFSTVPSEREITIYDLLRHTSGLSGGVCGTPAISNLYSNAGIAPYEHTAHAYESTSQEMVEKLSELPLAYKPGSVWEYSRAGDILGRLIEVISGQALDEFLKTRLFEPLGMEDTGFHVEPTKASRVAQPDLSQIEEKRLICLDRTPKFLSGGSGGISTVADYFRFALMLFNGGQFDGRRLLSRKTVELMTSDHLGPLSMSGPDYIPGPGYGFGFGVAVRKEAGGCAVPGSVGEYWWLGRAGTSFLVDPSEELVAILMLQVYGRARHYQALFKSLVYQAIDD
jgi:CubicO group peptidase (beta-lactamase class C family)